MSMIMSPEIAALCVISNAIGYREEKNPTGNSIVRFSISRKTLTHISRRKRLDKNFITQLSWAMFDMGWYILDTGKGSYVVHTISDAEKWTKINHAPRGKYAKMYNDMTKIYLNESGDKATRLAKLDKIANAMRKYAGVLETSNTSIYDDISE